MPSPFKEELRGFIVWLLLAWLALLMVENMADACKTLVLGNIFYCMTDDCPSNSLF